MSRLKQLEKVRQDFVANVSHELRTPLTSIKGYTETLLAESQPPPEVLASFLEVILKNTNHMVKMVDDLLQLARMEARQEIFKPARINPTEALMAAWKACLPVAQEKQVSLANHLPQEGLGVWADFDQLLRVFRNLLENAIRYSPEGEAITVDFRAEAQHRDHRGRVTTDPASPNTISKGFSSASTASRRAAAGSSAAQVWDWPSAATSCSITAA